MAEVFGVAGKKVGKKVIAVDFRDKKSFGWRAHTETLIMDDGSKISSEVFKNLFYGHTVLRPCCYKCPYKDVLHPGDITIVDYWGIKKAAPEFENVAKRYGGYGCFNVIKKKLKGLIRRTVRILKG